MYMNIRVYIIKRYMREHSIWEQIVLLQACSYYHSFSASTNWRTCHPQIMRWMQARSSKTWFQRLQHKPKKSDLHAICAWLSPGKSILCIWIFNSLMFFPLFFCASTAMLCGWILHACSSSLMLLRTRKVLRNPDAWHTMAFRGKIESFTSNLQ